MDQELFSAVDRFIGETIVAEDEGLRGAVEAAEAAGLPAIQVSPPQGKLLQLLVRLVGARRVLEFGTLGGYSAILMARALPADGWLISLVADNVVRDGSLADAAAADEATQAQRRLHESLAAEPRVDATTIQTVGVKGYDGFLVALVEPA